MNISNNPQYSGINIIQHYKTIQNTAKSYQEKELTNEAIIAKGVKTQNLKKGPGHIDDIIKSRKVKEIGKGGRIDITI